MRWSGARTVTVPLSEVPTVVLDSDMVLMSVLAAVRRDIEAGDLVPLGLFSSSLSGHYALVRLSGRTQLPALDIVYDLARRLCRA